MFWEKCNRMALGKTFGKPLGKRRRAFVLSVVLVIGFTCSCGKGKDGENAITSDRSAYEEANFTTVSIPEGIGAFALCEDGTMLCSGADGKLYQYDKNGAEKTEILSSSDGNSSFYRNLCVDGGNVYAYDSNQSAVVQLENNGGSSGDLSENSSGNLSQISSDNIRVIQNSLSLHTIRNMVALDGKIYVLAIPFTSDNMETFYSFGAGEFEDYGEMLYCIDVESGQYKTLDLGHIVAEYRSEDGRLFFYGWQEDKYYLYEYDTEKEKIGKTVTYDSMANLLNIVVEGGYLFGISSSDGLVSINLTTGEKLTWASGIYAMFGNDLQFYHGNLFVRNMAGTQEIRQVLVVDKEGEITEKTGKLDTTVADGTGGNGQGTDKTNQTETNRGDQEADGSGTTPEPTKRPKRKETIGVSTPWNYLWSTDEVRHKSGMKTKMIEQPLELEAIIAELMAGNPDVDIYVFPHGWALTPRVKELGLYVPLGDSEIIRDYIGKCFGYVRNAATSEDGNIWMVPVYGSCEATWYIPENMQKFNVAPEELTMFDSYMAVLERLQGEMGKYHYYNNAFLFMLECDSQYDVNYNDYDAGEINFDTEFYRHLFDVSWTGWDCYGSAEANHPLFFKVQQQTMSEVTTLGETPDFDRDTVIFKTISINQHLAGIARIGSDKFKELLEGWRVLPFPKLQSETEKETIALTYAFVNPYSRQKDAAIEYLEVLLENQADVTTQPMFLREDMAYYEQYYDTSVPAFQDLYNIFKNADVLHGYSWDLSIEYINEYQRGLISFDEAIARRQRSAVTGLEE